MSTLSKVLEKRIQELTASIDAQKTELAAYERVLQMEGGKGSASTETDSSVEEAPVEGSKPRKKRTVKRAYKRRSAPAESAPAAEESNSASVPDSAFSGNKTTMIAEIVKGHGSSGATPKEVDAFFTSRKIDRSKNLIYNTLSYLVAQKKLQRRDGKYFASGTDAAPAKKSAPTPTAAATPTKRRLSPEGLKRIKDALKKRWAAKRAADAGGAKPVKATKKK